MAELEARELMHLVNTLVAHACMGENRAAAALLHRATPAEQAAVGILVRRLAAVYAVATGVAALEAPVMAQITAAQPPKLDVVNTDYPANSSGQLHKPALP